MIKNALKVLLSTMLLLICFSNIFANSTRINQLFKQQNLKIENQANHTFVFWINGDAERFRPSSGIDDDIVRIDKQDVGDVRRAALGCECNVVLFFDQRGTDTWYTARKAWGVYLEVYANGTQVYFPKKIRRKKPHSSRYESIVKYYDNVNTDEVNQADSAFLTSLLKFSEHTFPDTHIHLVYRGHSFSEAYIPNQVGGIIAPFDYSHPDSAYSVGTFVKSIKDAELKRKLKSITFAACTMSYLDTLLRLSQFTDSVISSQIPILETGSTGFDLSFISKVNNSFDNQAVTKIIGENIYNKFQQTEESTDIIREAIISVIDLRDFKTLSKSLNEATNDLKGEGKLSAKQLQMSQVRVRPSLRYLDSKRELGVSQQTIATLEQKVQFGVVDKSYDLLKLMDDFEEYKSLVEELKNRTSLYGYSKFSSKMGINIKLK